MPFQEINFRIGYSPVMLLSEINEEIEKNINHIKENEGKNNKKGCCLTFIYLTAVSQARV
jgi:hypothetical protein